jgi:hypothetical protein
MNILNPYRFSSVLFLSMVIKSTSTSGSWSPDSISNSGTTLDWTVSNGVTIAKTTINDPTFDFSGNTGTADILIENTDDLTTIVISSLDISSVTFGNTTAFTFININDNDLTSFDISNSPSLTTVLLRDNNISTLGIFNTPLLTVLVVGNNNLPDLNVLPLTNLDNLGCQGNNFSATATNKLLSDLVTNGINNGNLSYRNNETGQGVTDRATLVTRGWTINNFVT